MDNDCCVQCGLPCQNSEAFCGACLEAERKEKEKELELTCGWDEVYEENETM